MGLVWNMAWDDSNAGDAEKQEEVRAGASKREKGGIDIWTSSRPSFSSINSGS